MNDPNKQQHHTFGSSLAALCLKEEVDKGRRYKSAVRLLNVGMKKVNEVYDLDVGSRRYWLQLLRGDICSKINNCPSDAIVKSLCCNLFVAKFRKCLRAPKEILDNRSDA